MGEMEDGAKHLLKEFPSKYSSFSWLKRILKKPKKGLLNIRKVLVGHRMCTAVIILIYSLAKQLAEKLANYEKLVD